MTDWIKDGVAIASLFGTLIIAGFGIIAIAGNAGKYAAQYTHSAPQSPLVSADASGAAPSRPLSPLATYSGEE